MFLHMLPMNLLKAACVCLVAVSTAGGAYIPSVALPELGWHGPGHLCEASFTLKVEEGERVVEDIQLEPWYPASDTIRSSAGWFVVTTMNRKPDASERIKRISSTKTGKIYSFRLIDPFAFSARFIFEPRDALKPFIEISFFRVDRPDPRRPDWHIAPQKSYDPERYADVISRIDFSNASQIDCLNPR